MQNLLEQLLAGSSRMGAAAAGAQAAGPQLGSPALSAAPEGMPEWSAPAAGPQDPLAALLQGSMRYQQQHGQDPLGAAAARGHMGNSGAFGSGSPVPTQVIDEQAQGLNRVAQLTSHGPREGQAHTTFNLGNGLRAHVYVDTKGRRKVFAFTPGDQPAA